MFLKQETGQLGTLAHSKHPLQSLCTHWVDCIRGNGKRLWSYTIPCCQSPQYHSLLALPGSNTQTRNNGGWGVSKSSPSTLLFRDEALHTWLQLNWDSPDPSRTLDRSTDKCLQVQTTCILFLKRNLQYGCIYMLIFQILEHSYMYMYLHTSFLCQDILDVITAHDLDMKENKRRKLKNNPYYKSEN